MMLPQIISIYRSLLYNDSSESAPVKVQLLKGKNIMHLQIHVTDFFLQWKEEMCVCPSVLLFVCIHFFAHFHFIIQNDGSECTCIPLFHSNDIFSETSRQYYWLSDAPGTDFPQNVWSNCSGSHPQITTMSNKQLGRLTASLLSSILLLYNIHCDCQGQKKNVVKVLYYEPSREISINLPL